MSYKQNKNPFSGSEGPAGFKNPKNKGTSNFNALQFQMPDLNNILNKTADGETVTEDKTNDVKTGTSDEGKVDGTPPKGSIDELANRNEPSSEKTYKDLKNEEKERRKDLKQDIKEAKRMQKDKGNILTDDQRQESADVVATLKDKRKFDRSARKDNISVEQAVMNEAAAQKQKAEEEKKEEERLFNERINDPYYQNLNIGPTLGNTSKGTQMRQVKTKGKGFPMVNPQQDPIGSPEPTPPAKGTMQMGGRPLNSGTLTNDPNNMLDPSKISAQRENTAQQFNTIASSAGTPTPQYNPYQTQMQGQNQMQGMSMHHGPSKALVGDQDELPDHLKQAIEAAPGMYNAKGPSSFDSLVKKLESEGKSKEAATKIAGSVANAKMKGAGSGPTAAQKARSKGAGMHSMDHAHTKVTAKNLRATEKDDAAHMDYLKRDVKYDAKHGGSDRQMTDDEKHISKLAGDLKYDKQKHGRKYDNV